MTLHPFEEGKTYRNRIGEYVVVAIDGDQMEVRYEDGGMLSTSVRIQSRIWENIQFEERIAREAERDRLARDERLAVRRRIREEKAIPKFGGFQEADFEAKKRGIAWSTRKKLGQVLAYQLSQRTQVVFGQWIVPRVSAVQVARNDRFEKDRRERNSAFFVAASETGMSCGFYMSKPEGKAQVAWPWSRTLAALEEGDKLRRSVRAAMKEHSLSFSIYAQGASYGLVGQVTFQDRGFEWRGETADQEVVRTMTWKKLLAALQELSGTRCELYLGKQVPAGEALEAGAEISSQILEVFEVLMPLYDTSAGV
jgi:hypothetical protein